MELVTVDVMSMEREEIVTEVAQWLDLANLAEDEATGMPLGKAGEVLQLHKECKIQKNLIVFTLEMEKATPEQILARAESEATKWINGIYGSAQAQAAFMRRTDNNVSVPKRHAKRGTRSMLVCPNSKAFVRNRNVQRVA